MKTTNRFIVTVAAILILGSSISFGQQPQGKAMRPHRKPAKEATVQKASPYINRKAEIEHLKQRIQQLQIEQIKSQYFIEFLEQIDQDSIKVKSGR